MLPRCAVEVTKENLSAIASEGGKNLDRKLVEKWFEDHGEGYFVRDEGTRQDCELYTKTSFDIFYRFERGDVGSLFRNVVRK